MSTRGAIARLNANESWEGRYHHWDSYPTGLGSSLYRLVTSAELGSLEATLTTLIDKHPAGWSTIVNADWSYRPGYVDRSEGPCQVCGKPEWRHYRQYYSQHGLPIPPQGPLGDARVFDHGFEAKPQPERPQCYCHGGRGEEGWLVTNENAAGSGVEYAYVFDVGRRHMLILSSYTDGGQKMIGMFGMGDPDAGWAILADVDLDGPAPDWTVIEAAA